ncbi:MAG: hypothetical protein RhofKO_07730 [Rhodothermales bacterium]
MLLIGFTLVTMTHPVPSASFGGGAPAQYTGAPGSQTCSAPGCHDSFALNSGTGTVSTSLAASRSYAGGDTLDFIVSVAQSGARRYGFQVTARDAANQPVGTFELVDTGTEFADRNPAYVTHSGNSTDGNWSVRWIAPAAADSDVTFYVAGNAANRNGTAKGDHIYTASTRVTATTSTFTETADLPLGLRLDVPFPNPARSHTTLTYTLGARQTVALAAYDAQGRQTHAASLGTQAAGTHHHSLSTSTWALGYYILEVRTPDGVATAPFLKL